MNKLKSIVNILYQNIIITILFFILIALVVNSLITNHLYQGAVDSGNVVANSIASHLQERMEEPERDILEIQKIISKDVLNQSSKDQYLQDILADNQFFMAIEILDRDGIVSNFAPYVFESDGMDRSGEFFYKNVKEEGKFYWSKLFTLIQNGEPTIAVSYADEDEIYVVYLDVNQISRLSVDYGGYFGEHIEMYITDENGTYISNPDEKMIFQRGVDQEIKRIQRVVEEGDGYFYSSAKDRLVSTAYVENVGWYVSLHNSLDYIYNPIKEAYYLFSLFLAVLLILSFVYYKKATVLSRAIQTFSTQTKEIASGNFNVEMDGQKYKELDHLRENFEVMAQELKQRDLRLEEYAYVDSLTGLLNRRAMMENLEQFVHEKSSFALAYFDLDQFKNINDSCGHFTGDTILKNVASRISECTPGNGVLARIGGDEFLYAVEGEPESSNIIEVVEKVIAQISHPFHLNGMELFMGISAGIAYYPQNADNVVDLLKFSDMAMYSAKSKGNNRLECFTSDLRAKFDRKMDIERQLRGAIDREEFSCVFQPQIELSKERIIGFESLLRWNSAELGNVSPEEFIRIAEERDLIGELTAWMIRKTCEGILRIQEKFGTSFRYSVNVSVQDLKDSEFPNKVLSILKEFQLDPGVFEIEITENMLIDNYNDIKDVLYQFKESGIRISLDDFGKGYSSLSYINQLPIDTLKIDRIFLETSQYHEKGYALIESIIQIGEKLNFTVIAEGIETWEQLDFLKKIDCFGGQGYLMCRPVPLEKLMEFIEINEFKMSNE